MMEKYETEMKEKQLNDDEEEKKSITENDTDSTAVVQKRSEPIIIKPKPYPRTQYELTKRQAELFLYVASAVVQQYTLYVLSAFQGSYEITIKLF